MTQRQNQKPSISQLYQIGDFIDAKDNQGDWRVGYIVQKSDITKTFKVRFDGWAAKYDEIYRYENQKLRQFRQIVIGYTGQKQLPALRQGWKFTLPQHENKLRQIFEYVIHGKQQKIKTAHQYNQWIRGHNYFYVDFLMTVTYSSLQQIKRVLQYFKLNIRFCINYLKYIVQNFQTFVSNLQKTNNQHLEDVQVAKSFAFYQIFDMMYTITGSYHRLGCFFKQNQDFLKQQLQISGNKDVKHYFQIKMIEFFYKSDGFTCIDQIFKKLLKLNKPMPFIFLNSFAHLYAGVSVVVQTKSKQAMIKQFKLITQKSIQLLSDKQMKDLNQHELIQLINEIHYFTSKTSMSLDIYNWSQFIELQIFFKMITCPFFQKKLRGITYLHQFIQKRVDQNKDSQNLDIIADGTISKWIEQKKLFDILLSNDNPQLIKKTTQLIKYLYHKDNKMQKYIILVWKYRQGKHQTVLKQIYNFLGDIPIYDKKQQFTNLLFTKYISQVKQELWDIDYIKMIKDYTINALFSIIPEDIKETFGFQILYKFAQRYSNDQNLLNYLIEICKKLQKTQFLQNFVLKCFSYIQKSHNSKFHVSLLVGILRQKMIQPRNIKLDVPLIIQKHIVRNKSQQNQKMDQKFQLLNQYLKKAKQIIPDQNFIQFWKQMINSKNRSSFFKWIYKTKDSGKVIITSFINLQTKFYLIQNFWNDDYLLKHPIDEYEATFLLQLFKFINDKSDKIKRDGLVYEVLDQNLTGIQKLHAAYKYTNNTKAAQILSKGLAQVYTSGGQSLLQLKVDLVQDFISKIANQSKHYSKTNNTDGIIKMIRLVQQLISRDQQIFDCYQAPKIQSIKTYFVKNLITNQEKPFRVNLLQSMYNFKRLIALSFGLTLHKFDIIINDENVLNYQQYFKTIGQSDIKGKILIKPRNPQNSKIKTQLNHHLDLLFQLLGNKQIQVRVWNIVSKLPISNQIRQKIILSQNPLQILQHKSFYKQLYMFKAALSIQKKWWNIQIQNMIRFFLLRLQNTPVATEIQRQYIMVSIKLLQKIILLDQMPSLKLFTQTFGALFSIAKRIFVEINQIQKINPLNVKKFIQSFFIIADLFNKYWDATGQKAQPDALSLMFADPQIKNLFKLCLIDYKHQPIRKQFPIRLAKLAITNKQKHAKNIASIVLNELLDETQASDKRNLREFHLFSNFLLQTLSKEKMLFQFYAQNKSRYFQKLFKLIQNQQPQQNIQSINVALLCYTSMIRHVIQQVSQQDLFKYFDYINKECLFKGNQSKCKYKQTRSSIFNFFIRLIKLQRSPQMIYNHFGNLHINGIWRSRKLQDWTITYSDRLKSSTGYTGLKNLGCICYMNSFFQQIFMVQQFRRALLLAEDPYYNEKTIDENVLYQVKKMFMNLMFSDKKFYNPRSFCLSFKDYQGNPTNVNQQMDIDQFSGILFDRLQTSLKGTKYSNLIKQTFGGIFSNQIICKGCPHFSQTQESFLSLALTVKDKKSIYESLQTMIKGDTLDGDNAYYCERCDKKVSAVKRVCLKSLPNYLIVALKRFEFDYNTMQKLKVNQYCEFPHQLNLEQYSYQYLRKKQNPKFQTEEIKSKKYYEYKLKGVVIHIGYADSGHYYSLIQERNGQQRWLEFNDSIVRNFNVENLHEQAFGGQTGGIQSKEKIKNAYLLIYERVQKINSIKQQVISQGNSFLKMNMYSEVINTINQQNFQYNIQSTLFSPEYLRFILTLIEQAGKTNNINLQKFIILSFLTTIIRSKTDPGSFQIIQKIYNSFGKGNNEINSWLLTQFCDIKIFDQFLRNCPIRQIKRNIATWITLILKQLQNNDIKITFLKIVISKITTQNQNNIQALTILHNLIDDDICLNLLIQNSIIGRMLQNIIRKEPRAFGSVQNLLPLQNQIKSQFGYQLIIQKTPFQLKKIKYDNQTGIVWALAFKLMFKFRKLQLLKILHPKQLQYLSLTRQKIYKLLQQAKNKFDIDSLTNYLCYLAQQNHDFSQMLAELVQKGLKEFQSKRYRQFFQLFRKLIGIQDQFAQQRVTWVNYVFRSLKQNEKYAMDCTIIELWLCKIINENQRLRSYLIRQRSLLQYLSVLPLKKVPSDQLSKKNINFGEASVNKYHGIPFPTSRRGYMKLLKSIEDFYQKLLKGVYQPIHHFQSGNHIVYDKLGAGDKIAFFDIKDKVDYQEATIKEVFLDKICIVRKSLPNKPFWTWIQDQKLTSNLNVIKDQNSHELDSSKTTEMEDEIDFEAIN